MKPQLSALASTVRALALGLSSLALCTGIVSPVNTRAQIVQLQAGTSTLYRAQGGSVALQMNGFQGTVAGGIQDGAVRLGASVHKLWRGYDLLLGDDTLQLELPTDVFDSSHYVQSRGLAVGRNFGRLRLSAFAGASSTRFGTTFFQTAQAEQPLGALNVDMPLSESVALFSRLMFSHKQTLISGVRYRPRRWLNTSIAAGSGTGDRYLAAAVTADRTWISAKAEYVQMGERFRRLITAGPQGTSSEVDRDNLQVTFRPTINFSFGGGRQHLLQPVDRSAEAVRGEVTNFFVAAKLLGFDLRSSVYESDVQDHSTTGLSFNLGRRLTNRVETGFAAYQSRPSRGRATASLNATLRETLTPRLGLSQTITRSSGQTNVGFGGVLGGNRLNLSVDYQTVFVPFQSSGLFKQAAAFSLRVRPVGNLEFGANSFIAPDGHMRYTFTAGTSVIRYGTSKARDESGIGRYVIIGAVTDENGNGIAGLAFRIDGITVYTDRAGHFSARFNKRKIYPFTYVPEDSVAIEVYDLVSAPDRVQPSREGEGEQVKVRVRRRINLSHGTEFRTISQTQTQAPAEQSQR